MNCVDCGRMMRPKNSLLAEHPGTIRHAGRGLCDTCYGRRWRAGTLDDVPKSTWPRDLLLAEWRILRDRGYTVRDAAPRLGMTRDALQQALVRARRDGHPDAVRPFDQHQWPTKNRGPA